MKQLAYKKRKKLQDSVVFRSVEPVMALLGSRHFTDIATLCKSPFGDHRTEHLIDKDSEQNDASDQPTLIGSEDLRLDGHAKSNTRLRKQCKAQIL